MVAIGVGGSLKNSILDIFSLKKNFKGKGREKKKQKKNDPEGIRTLNLLIRSQTPYPLGHEAGTL